MIDRVKREAFLLVLTTTTVASAQVAWDLRELSPNGGPVAGAYDSGSGRFFVFTSQRAGGGQRMWEWTGLAWVRPTSQNEPAPSLGVRMAFDAARAVRVLFDQRSLYEWSGGAWTQVTTAPAGSFGADIAYDPVSRATVLAGPSAGTWTWDGTTWAQMSASTPPVSQLTTDLGAGRTVGVSATGTYQFNGTGWTRVANAPAGIVALGYDAAQNRLQAFTGSGSVWTLGGGSWSVGPGPNQGNVISAAFGFDPTAQGMVLFIGQDASPGTQPAYTNATWLWRNSSWSAAPRPAPAPRTNARMVHDVTRDRVLMFGGTNATGLSTDPIWTWDGSAWQATATSTQPKGGVGAFAFDRRRGVAVWVSRGETWEWNGTWTARSLATPAPNANNVELVYDEGLDQCVLTVGGATPQTWLYDGATWAQHTGPVQPGWQGRLVYDAGRGESVWVGMGASYTLETLRFRNGSWSLVPVPSPPPPSLGYALVYDRTRQRVVMQGGGLLPAVNYTTSSATWEFDGTSWQRRNAPTGPRQLHAAAYDEGRDEVVCFGGEWENPAGTGTYAPLDDTWTYGPTTPARFTTFGAGCPGQNGTPVLSATTRPWLGTTFVTSIDNVLPAGAVAYLGSSDTTWGTTSLPLALGSYGLTGCSLHVEPLASLVVMPTGPTQGTYSTPIPNQASLLGQSFFTQVFAVDPTANPAGIIASEGGRAQVGGL